MTSSENVEIVRRLLDGFSAGIAEGDFGGGARFGGLAEDFEWVPARELAPGDRYVGVDAFIGFMTTWTEDFDDWSLEIERLVDGGDRVVAVVTQRATGHGSGAPVELHFGQVYEFEAGKVATIRNFLDPAEAFRSAEVTDPQSP